MRKQSRPQTERKPLPTFRTEREERAFWETHDTSDYVDWGKASVGRFPNLKPSTTTISLRLPTPLLADLKTLANKRDVPYQSLLKVYLAERVLTEHRGGAPPNKRRQPARAAARTTGARRRARG
jgi:predicted DNA binding CopG/RHH family protein